MGAFKLELYLAAGGRVVKPFLKAACASRHYYAMVSNMRNGTTYNRVVLRGPDGEILKQEVK